MKALARLFLIAVPQLCFAEDATTVLATSEWSKPVETKHGHSLRARMIVAQGRGAAFAGQFPETQFFLEFQNVTGSITAPTQFYFDPSGGLQCVMKDADGKTPSQAGGGSGGGPGACWITLPYDSTIRLRANMYGYGKKPGDGLLLCLWPPTQYWNIAAGDTKDYFLSGSFTVVTPPDSAPKNPEAARAIWAGTLELPAMKISLGKP